MPSEQEPPWKTDAESVLTDLMTTQRDWVDACLARGMRQWTPSLAVDYCTLPAFERRRELCMLDVSFDTPAEKKVVLTALGRRCFEEDRMVYQLAFCGTAWLTEQPDGRPRDDPGRREVVILFGQHAAGWQACAHLPLERGPDGVIRPGAWEEMPAAGLRLALLRHFWDGYLESIERQRRILSN